MVVLLSVSGVAWLVLEVSLRMRDRSRSQGSTGQDRGTRALNFALVVVAVVVADVLSAVIGKHSPLWIPGAGADGWPMPPDLAGRSSPGWSSSGWVSPSGSGPSSCSAAGSAPLSRSMRARPLFARALRWYATPPTPACC